MKTINVLTEKQKEYLRLMALGYSDKAICEMKYIAQGTLNGYRARIYNALEIFAKEEKISPRVLASIQYWQENIDEFKEINLNDIHN